MMNTFNQTWTPGYDQFGRFCWYNEATGLVHHPLQPAGDVPHRRQVRQGLSSTSGRHVGRVGACPERREEAKGSYFNPLAAEMAEWGVLIQKPRNDGAWTPWQSENGWRRMTWNNSRGLEPKKKLVFTPPTVSEPHQERTRSRRAQDRSTFLPPMVARFRRVATR